MIVPKVAKDKSWQVVSTSAEVAPNGGLGREPQERKHFSPQISSCFTKAKKTSGMGPVCCAALSGDVRLLYNLLTVTWHGSGEIF